MCDFAHGLDELTGEGREEFLRELAKQKKEKEQKQKKEKKVDSI